MTSIVRWLVHTVTIQEPLSVAPDAHGDPTWSPARTIRARVERTSTRVRNGDGDEVVSSHRMIATEHISERARFWLPSIMGEPADDTTKVQAARTPITSQAATNRSGTQGHWEYYF